MITSFFLLTRPLNVLIAALSALIAASLSPLFDWQVQIVYALLSVAFITASANIVNDIYDVEIDKINKPNRPLANGRITISQAWLIYFLLNLFGLSFAFLVGYLVVSLALLAIFLLFLYSYHFKRTILVGNVFVSFASGFTFVYAALSIDDWKAGIIPGIFTFLFHLGREIIKDIQDLEGDIAKNAITFPGRFGMKRSLVLVNAVFIILCTFLISPVVLDNYNVYYTYIVVCGVVSVLLFISVFIWFRNNTFWLGRYSLLLKLDMFVGLAAIYAGVNFPT